MKKKTDANLNDLTIRLAGKASELADRVRSLRRTYRQNLDWLEAFDRYWGESPLLLHFVACFTATLTGFALGYEMYDSLLTDQYYVGLETAPVYAVMFLSAFFSTFSLITGVLAARAFNPKYQEWVLLQEVAGGGLPEKLRYEADSRTEANRLYFAGMLFLTSGTVIMVIYQRLVWLVTMKEDFGAGEFLIYLLPFVVFLFEMISSEGAILYVRRQCTAVRIARAYRHYKITQAQLADLDKKVSSYWDKVCEETQPQAGVFADIHCCLYRSRFRPTDSDGYADEVPGPGQ